MLENERVFWQDLAERIAKPVLEAAASGQLKARMPVEVSPRGDAAERAQFSHLEAVGRLLCGIAPWLELADSSNSMWRERALKSIDSITDPHSPDFLNFDEGAQPLVDAAFLAQALLRAPQQLWHALDGKTQQNVVAALRKTRRVTPALCNWLLFSATIEAFFAFAGEEWDAMRVDFALNQHAQFYLGDGTYSDGPHLAWDYYNSYVIHPMIVDVVRVCASDARWSNWRQMSVERLSRYAEILENLVAPDGSYPMLGRSSAYRCGAFHALAQAALLNCLPASLTPAQARSAMTAAIKRQMNVPGTFDEQGWLRIGFYGHQPEVGESYISTGSLYLCSTALLPLGLPADHNFWTGEPCLWTQRRVWGKPMTS